MKTMSPRALFLLQPLTVRCEDLPSREEERVELSRGARRIVAQRRQRMRGWRRRIAADPREASRSLQLLGLQLEAALQLAEAYHHTAGTAVTTTTGPWFRAVRDHEALLEALGLVVREFECEHCGAKHVLDAADQLALRRGELVTAWCKDCAPWSW